MKPFTKDDPISKPEKLDPVSHSIKGDCVIRILPDGDEFRLSNTTDIESGGAALLAGGDGWNVSNFQFVDGDTLLIKFNRFHHKDLALALSADHAETENSHVFWLAGKKDARCSLQYNGINIVDSKSFVITIPCFEIESTSLHIPAHNGDGERSEAMLKCRLIKLDSEDAAAYMELQK